MGCGAAEVVGLKLAWIALLAVLGLAFFSELGLRWLFGFGKPPLYVADDVTGYRLAPQQQTRRFGNRITINQFSLRGEEITPQPDSQTFRLLLLGDSIANGGWWTDDSQTISAQLERSLAGIAPQVQVLNASANSWGPRNEWGFVRKFGTFGSSMVVLLLNTDDLFSRKPTSVVVGRDRNYPQRRPPLAWVEVISRFLPPPEIPELEDIKAQEGDIVASNLTAIAELHEFLQRQEIGLFVALTPLKRELGEPGSRDYELKARERLWALLGDRKIPHLDVLPLLNQFDDPTTLYRDSIHFNQAGNTWISEQLTPELRSQLAAE